MSELLHLDRVVADGYHNAFTDLLFWRGHYYLSFRKAQHHGITPPGTVVILRSADLTDWEPAAVLNTGGDDRDPKLVDAGDKIGVVFGTWFPRWNADSLTNGDEDLISHVSTSRDGLCWSAPKQVHGINYWLWRVLADGANGFYCAPYHFPGRARRTDRSIHLLHSDDLLEWRHLGTMRELDDQGEAVLYRSAPDTLRCIIRRNGSDGCSYIGESSAPYTDWQWRSLEVCIHAPVMLETETGWICSGRSRPGDLPPGTVEPDSGSHTSVWRIPDEGAAEHLLTVPSAGDCSYCGFAKAPNGDVLMSYYSQHDRMPLDGGMPTPADVYIARIKM